MATACRLARRLQTTLTSAEMQQKADTSPVTIADYAVQAIIVHALQRHFPTDVFIAEESTAALRADTSLLRAVVLASGLDEMTLLRTVDACNDAGGSPCRTWVLDPIDGTRGFIARRQYCIALALLEGREVQLGVLGCPNLSVVAPTADSDGAQRDDTRVGCIFYARRGLGAFQVAEDDVDDAIPNDDTRMPRGTRLHVADLRKPEWATWCESVERAHSSHARSARIASRLAITSTPMRMDSMAKYGCMARGQVSLFLRFPRGGYVENVWDCAPAAIIVTEAGGRVTDGRGQDLDFGLGRKMNNQDGIVATNGAIHDAVIDAVRLAIAEEQEEEA